MELRPAVFDRNVSSFVVPGFAEPFAKRGERLSIRGRRGAVEVADHRHHLLLRAERRRDRHRADQQEHEFAALHSMTSSARSRSVWGIVTPSSFAVFRLTTSSYRVGCSTGKSAGFAPLRILST